jgi:hypothetical protein
MNSKKILRPDIAQAGRFLSLLDPYADIRSLLDGGPDGFTFQTFDDDKARKSVELAKVFHGTLPDHYKQLVAYNASRAGIFVTINETDQKGRKNANITRVRATWIDDDEPDREDIPTPLEPHIVCETSPGKVQKLFLVKGMSFDQHRQVQEVLIAKYGSDKGVKDLARVLRIPGFYHNKGEPFMVRIIHESGREPYTAEEMLDAFPYDVIEDVIGAVRPKTQVVDRAELDEIEPGYSPLSSSEPLPDIDASNARDYLPEAGSQTYPEWRDIGMILHHQFRGSEEGLIIFDEWSQGAREYKGIDDVIHYWNSFGKRGEGPELTFKTLIKEKKKELALQKKDVAVGNAVRGKRIIEDCVDYMLLVQDVAPKVFRLADKNVILENDFCTAIRLRYGELRPGFALTKPDAMKAMKVKHGKKKQRDHELGLDNPDTPEWARGWVWVSGNEVFFNVHTRVDLTTRGFRGYYDAFMVGVSEDERDSATYLRDNNLIPKVMHSMYAPQFGTLFNHEGVSFVNTYSTQGRCEIPDEIQSLAAVAAFKKHFELTCGGWNREAQIMCNWFADCIRGDFVKVRWALLLIGVEGSGKGCLQEFVGRVLGASNVRSVACSTIMASAKDGKSGWAEGHRFAMIDELKLHGHNRYDAINFLKSYITNDVVSCRQMYKEARDVLNTVNYFLTSNYSNAAPLTEGDRRYFVIESKIAIADLDSDYFVELFGAIRNHTGDLAAWLLSVPRHPEYNPDGIAPMTKAKEDVIRLNVDDFDTQIAEIIEDDNDYQYDNKVVLFTPLLDRVTVTVKRIGPDYQYLLKQALTALGYKPVGRVRFGGERHSAWAKEINGERMTPEDVVEHLKKQQDKAIASGDEVI